MSGPVMRESWRRNSEKSKDPSSETSMCAVWETTECAELEENVEGKAFTEWRWQKFDGWF